jgi:DNA-directed RNA polymerase specialized sigma24 family protein
MTADQFAALSELLRLRGGPATDAARLVLVDGLSAAEAAQRAGVSRTAATNAVTRCRRGLVLVGRVVG